MESTDAERMRAFQKYLSDRSIPAPVRYSRGQDVSAACGQLAAKREGELEMAPRLVALARRREYLAAKNSQG
jgi:23S rRNA (adenine2503-C2)-methyltransferase